MTWSWIPDNNKYENYKTLGNGIVQKIAGNFEITTSMDCLNPALAMQKKREKNMELWNILQKSPPVINVKEITALTLATNRSIEKKRGSKRGVKS